MQINTNSNSYYLVKRRVSDKIHNFKYRLLKIYNETQNEALDLEYHD